MITETGLARTFMTRRGLVEAVKGVDISVAAGEIVGFVGPNGAGKTTTLRMLTTLLEPTAGTARVAGCDLRTDPVGVRRRIGYISQSGVTLPEARAGEEVVDRAMLYGLSKAEATSRGMLLFAELDLDKARPVVSCRPFTVPMAARLVRTPRVKHCARRVSRVSTRSRSSRRRHSWPRTTPDADGTSRDDTANLVRALGRVSVDAGLPLARHPRPPGNRARRAPSLGTRPVLITLKLRSG